jgi:uncharacterized integral membrane protein
MAIARLFLPLLILVGLALFALQNWLPVLPLVLAGFNTQPLPLAIWMLAAIVAGAATTVAVSTLFSLTRFTAVRRSNHKQRISPPPYRPEGNPEGNSRSWATPWQNRTADRASSPKTRLQPEEDWDNRQSREEWDDWDEDAPRSSAQTEVRDRADEDWDNWEGYPEADRPRRAVRTDFEAKQAPVTQNQSGSLYSVSYEKADTQRPNEVYDADYRVVVPPFTAAEPPAPELDDEDWGFDDDDIPDEPRDRRTR